LTEGIFEPFSSSSEYAPEYIIHDGSKTGLRRGTRGAQRALVFQGRTGIYCIIKTNSSRGVTRDPKFQFNSSRELELRDIPQNFANENIPGVVVNAQ
jgi:hypothetical protein